MITAILFSAFFISGAIYGAADQHLFSALMYFFSASVLWIERGKRKQ